MSLQRVALLAASCVALAAAGVQGQKRFVEWSRHAESLLLGNVTAADIDADDDLDVISLNSRYVGVHINDGTGRFADETAQRAPLLPIPIVPWRPIVVDLDGDGDVDIATQVGILINDGRGYFKDETAARYPRRIDTWLIYHPQAVDIDNDGDRDLLFLQGALPPTISIPHLWINDGRGFFRDETSTRLRSKLYVSVSAGDVDGDGDLDLVSAGEGSPACAFVVLKNDGKGVFDQAWSEPLPDPGPSGTPGLFDFDRDGDLDMYLVRWPDRFYRNDGKGGWQQDSSVIVAGPDQYYGDLLVGDFTSDGYPDVLKILSPIHNGSSLLVHDGQGRLWAQPGAVIWRDHMDVAAGDFDGDGDLDMATAVFVQIPPNAPKGLVIDMNLDRHVHAMALPRLGQPWDVDLWSLRTPALFLPFISAGQAATPLPLPGLGVLRLDPATMVALGPWQVTGTSTKATMRLPMPSDTAFFGLSLSIQAGFARDNRLRLSNVLTQRIQ